MGDSGVNLPPGFQFDPTDEELILHFLYHKVARLPFNPNLIPELDLFPCDPWEVNGKALSSGNRWYFFSQMIENRVTENGYWKQLDIDEPVVTSATKNVGIKKNLVFFMGETPGGIKTDWIMQEYHLSNGLAAVSSKRRENQKLDLNKWVLCCIQERNGNCPGSYHHGSYDDEPELSFLDEVFLSMDDDGDEISFAN
ncbi:hypothetical protein F0562_005793 [Nyssa sinensis]|uniref:NAC domain-containing protein n=1 Tax=Nyssa sinensis TaxID=561372 RepID=A0A5J5ALF9_9ASTE|nr:hypothetical protein F0562_005793 [Nyssa sinensis]